MIINFYYTTRSHTLQLAAELGAHAVSHLENVSETGIEAMAQAGVVGVLLPTTAYILRLHPPPARRMIEKGQLICGDVMLSVLC